MHNDADKKEKNMDKYEVLDLEIISFETCDVIVTSDPEDAPGDIVSE